MRLFIMIEGQLVSQRWHVGLNCMCVVWSLKQFWQMMPSCILLFFIGPKITLKSNTLQYNRNIGYINIRSINIRCVCAVFNFTNLPNNTRDAQASFDYCDRRIRCHGRPSIYVVCDAQQRWQRLAFDACVNPETLKSFKGHFDRAKSHLSLTLWIVLTCMVSEIEWSANGPWQPYIKRLNTEASSSSPSVDVAK